MERTTELQTFLDRAEAVIYQNGTDDARIVAAAGRIFGALTAPMAPGKSPPAPRPKACAYLPVALGRVRGHPGPIGALADAFAGIAPGLGWTPRAGAAAHGETFLHGHANGPIMGPGEGLEPRPDVRIGVSLMAPSIRYPDHHHPPEEIYIVLSDGEWRQGNGAWHAPGIGGLVYNPPNILHAMRSIQGPLLALWFLWIGP